MSSFFTIKGSITLGILGALLLPSAFVACGGGGETTAAQGSTGSVGGSSAGQGGHASSSSNSSSSSSSSSAGQGGGGGQDGGGQDGGNVTPCPPATICLDVKLLLGQTTAGRLGVFWYQFNDNGPDPVPLIAYDTAFDPATKRVEIPIASIGIPNAENLLCQRACDDEAMCPCLSDPQVGTGYIIVAADTNANGKLDPGEINTGLYGLAYMGMGYSAKAYMPAPAPYNGLFPEGIDKDVRPYRIIPKGNGNFDALGRTKDGDVFDLNMCISAALPLCNLPSPNLT